jgi:hypothetical protein
VVAARSRDEKSCLVDPDLRSKLLHQFPLIEQWNVLDHLPIAEPVQAEAVDIDSTSGRFEIL